MSEMAMDLYALILVVNSYPKYTEGFISDEGKLIFYDSK